MYGKVFEVENCIYLNPNNRNELEIKKLATELKIDYYEAKNELKWHEINGKYYHFKFSDRLFAILNELIGPKIAMKLQLESVINIPAIMYYENGKKLYGILSENFKKQDKEYIDMFELGLYHKIEPESEKNISRLKRLCQKEDYNKILNSLFKMTCVDYIMLQVDRVASNFLFEKNGRKTSFSSLFDYSESYKSSKLNCAFDIVRNPELNFTVGNSFICLNFFSPKFNKFLNKYPNFIKYLEIVKKINIIEILEEIEQEYKIDISDKHKEHYDVITKDRQKIIEYI